MAYDKKIIMSPSQLRPGDIIGEFVIGGTEFGKSFWRGTRDNPTLNAGEEKEVGRFLITGRLIEQVTYPYYHSAGKQYGEEVTDVIERSNVYFKTIVIFSKPIAGSFWNIEPGFRYLLSEYEIANYNRWKWIHRSDMDWGKEWEEMVQNGTQWDTQTW